MASDMHDRFVRVLRYRVRGSALQRACSCMPRLCHRGRHNRGQYLTVRVDVERHVCLLAKNEQSIPHVRERRHDHGSGQSYPWKALVLSNKNFVRFRASRFCFEAGLLCTHGENALKSYFFLFFVIKISNLPTTCRVPFF